MTLDAGKLLQNIEVKVRGRTAIVVCGIFCLGFVFWVVFKDYPFHPLFSAVCGTGILVAILGLIGFGLLGKTRPEEIPDKSLLRVDKLDMGILVAHGIGSHKDMIRLLREVSGMRKLPPPAGAVRGSASNEKDYVQLTPAQADSAISDIEEGIQKFLFDVVAEAGDKLSQPRLEQTRKEPTSDLTMKGRTDLST